MFLLTESINPASIEMMIILDISATHHLRRTLSLPFPVVKQIWILCGTENSRVGSTMWVLIPHFFVTFFKICWQWHSYKTDPLWSVWGGVTDTVLYCTTKCCQVRTEKWSLSRALTHTSLSAHGAVRWRSGGGRNEFHNNFFENVSPVLALLILCRFTSFCLRRVICHHHQHPCLDSMLGLFLLLLRQAPFDHKDTLQSLRALSCTKHNWLCTLALV